jgi:hypothetical protein
MNSIQKFNQVCMKMTQKQEEKNCSDVEAAEPIAILVQTL